MLFRSGPDADGDGLCDEGDPDADNDGVLDDGDGSGQKGDQRCRDGRRDQCDDNCPLVSNAKQYDADNDAVGDACDTRICRSSSRLVVTGSQSAIYTSTDDGDTWTDRSTGTEQSWIRVAHGRGTWMILSAGREFARSTDGTNWEIGSHTLWDDNSAIRYGDDLWLIASTAGELAVSVDDGLTFSPLGTPVGWSVGTPIHDI